MSTVMKPEISNEPSPASETSETEIALGTRTRRTRRAPRGLRLYPPIQRMVAARPEPIVRTGPDRTGAMAPITGLRWVVSLWVLVLHTSFGAISLDLAHQYAARGGMYPALGRFIGMLGRIAAFGFSGTSLFLVLGGYALAVSSVDAETGTLTRSATNLWRSRFVRFAPLFVLTQALRIPQFILHRGDRPWHDMAASLAVNLSGLQAWFPRYVWDLNDPSWTLSVLFTCWVLFPLIAPRISRLSPRAALIALGACVAYSLSVASAMLLFDGAANPDVTATDFWLSFVHTNPLVRVPEFVAGVLLVRVHRSYAAWIAEHAPQLLALGLGGLALGCALNGVLVPYVFNHNGLMVPVACLLFLGLTSLQSRPAPAGMTERGTPVERFGMSVVRWLSQPAFQRFGGAGFTLYLIHGVPIAVLIIARNATAGRALLYSGRPIGSTGWELLLALGYCAVCAVVAIALHERVVLPFTAWFSDRLPKVGTTVARSRPAPGTADAQSLTFRPDRRALAD